MDDSSLSTEVVAAEEVTSNEKAALIERYPSTLYHSREILGFGALKQP
jgi:hypothetical protein